MTRDEKAVGLLHEWLMKSPCGSMVLRLAFLAAAQNWSGAGACGF